MTLASEETSPREDYISRQLARFAERASELADRVAAGRLRFVDGVDIAYEAAVWSGLSDDVGDDAVQRVLATAFATARPKP
jgi:hypothetical protein